MLQLLLFQSTERVLIDVESVRVATIGMEKILKLLTERDIEHTNNLPLLFSSYLHLPFLRSNPPPRRARVNISLSLGLSHPISIIYPCINLCYIRKTLPYIQKLRTFLAVYTKLAYLMLPDVFRAT